MATIYSIIIPVYKVDNHLDICLLSILGQITMPDVEVICVPVWSTFNDNDGRLEAWHKRDGRVKVASSAAQTLYDALRMGIASASGSYLMFMYQTDVISSIDNLSLAFTTAEQLDVQVLLTAKEQRVDINALSPSELFVPNSKLLPKEIDGKVYSIDDASINLFIMTPPVVYGNIYQRQYMAEMFSFPHIFGNAGDLAVSQIALLHAQRVSHTDISTIRSRYEECIRPFITPQEVQQTIDTLERQITVKMTTNRAEMIVQNIMVLYLAHLLSAYHPYKSFVHAVEYYKPLCQQMSNPITTEITQHLFGCLNYITAIAHSDKESLIETYTMPMRGIVFSGYVVRPVTGNRE